MELKDPKKATRSISFYLHLLIDVHWITKSPVVEGKVKVDAGASVVCLSHPERKTIAVKLCRI